MCRGSEERTNAGHEQDNGNGKRGVDRDFSSVHEML